MGDGTEVLYWVTKYPWPLSSRDYLFIRCASCCLAANTAPRRTIKEGRDPLSGSRCFVVLSRACVLADGSFAPTNDVKVPATALMIAQMVRVDRYASNGYFVAVGSNATAFVFHGGGRRVRD
jgi:hypothetical protein